MKILIKGYYGFGNLGDDLLMWVTYKLVKEKYPDAEITIFSNYNENLQGFNRKPCYNNYIFNIIGETVPLIDWTFKGYFDLVVNGGGGIYFDNKKGPSFYYFFNLIVKWLGIERVNKIDSFLRRIFKKPHHLKFGKRVGIGIGIGKFHASARLFYLKIAEIGSYKSLIVRDQYSLKFLSTQKMNKDKVGFNTDLAFINSWNKWWSWQERDYVKSVGIIVKDNLETPLLDNLIRLAENLKRKDIIVTIYLFDENYDSQVSENFSQFNCIHYNPLKMLKYLDKLRKEDLLYTTRAHGAIIGACLGVPSVVINNQIKLKEVSNMLKRSCIKIDSWKVENLMGAFETINNNYSNTLANLSLDFQENNSLSKDLTKFL